jgi:hypothetical protein
MRVYLLRLTKMERYLSLIFLCGVCQKCRQDHLGRKDKQDHKKEKDGKVLASSLCSFPLVLEVTGIRRQGPGRMCCFSSP